MKREYPDHPLVGVAAVLFTDTSVVLARRDREPGKGRWSLPGGLVELGEAHVTALGRELREELSVTVAIGGLVGVFDKIYLDSQDRVQYHYVVIDYWGWITSGDPMPSSDISEVMLAPLENLEALDLNAELVTTIRKAERHRQQRVESKK